ncbi:hypothetical protein CCR80_09195 [Rhodothalassium salexigens]|uniref:YceI family protein n=1 Tax=Rhodothalassium salexigens TaxID=1086 RepID=UPI0019121FA1|nr:YceI family protein [Rhodothalassium salexigens]MBK5921206.1 hypothetical protein [Rhodothalassium salexigens]
MPRACFRSALLAATVVSGLALPTTAWHDARTAAHAADAAGWRLVDADSHLTFRVRQMGATMDGRFDRFTADIEFDPDDLDPASARVIIDMASADVDNAQGNRILASAPWFDVANHPRAVFETTAIRPAENDPNPTGDTGPGYRAEAQLTIKGRTQTLALPFTLHVDGDRAHMTGETTLDRHDFGIGGGDADDTVSETVTVRVDIIARRN